MRKPSICIVSPALASANNGNWQTAWRWSRILATHYRTGILQTWHDEPFDMMLALHARRSADSVARWHARHPHKPLAVVLTGTDLYRDIQTDAQAQRSIALAHRLVVLQELGGRSLPPPLRHKCSVIFQSATHRQPLDKPGIHLRALMVGHLREEKAPETYFAAARLLAGRPDILLDHIGAPLDAALGALASQLQRECPNYRWLGAVGHEATRRRIQRAHVLVHPSRIEGGAHVIMEAVMSGTPVLASRIDGNVGMLGANYAGYFDCGDTAQLAQQLLACREGQFTPDDLLGCLQTQSSLRSHLFEPAAEKAALMRLMNDLTEIR